MFILSPKSTFVVVMFLFLSGSCREKNKADTTKKFESLSEDEKRLPQNALSSFTIPANLQLQLFAAEPLITNPTNISIDDRGRVWVCEAYNYDVPRSGRFGR